MSVLVERKAFGATVPETSVEFVHGGSGIEPVDQISTKQVHFACIVGRADTIGMGGMLET